MAKTSNHRAARLEAEYDRIAALPADQASRPVAKPAPPLLRPLRCGGCGCATVTLALPPGETTDYIVATCTECASPTIISIRTQMVIDWPSLHASGIEDGDGCLAQY